MYCVRCWIRTRSCQPPGMRLLIRLYTEVCACTLFHYFFFYKKTFKPRTTTLLRTLTCSLSLISTHLPLPLTIFAKLELKREKIIHYNYLTKNVKKNIIAIILEFNDKLRKNYKTYFYKNKYSNIMTNPWKNLISSLL